ncbi:MAG: hypothetical protein H6838_03510 [Planctomycetes bacterium]|nr:hypothetical protein [Planctomycetota bacterium]MCB9884531.1 hypothetical protein [Planctomycetota bacterium]
MRALHLSLLLLAALPSCLQMEQTVELRADGSGTQTVHMDVGVATLDKVQKASAAAQLGAAANPFAVFDKELVGRELAAAGLELTKHETGKKAQRRTVDLQASFAKFSDLQQSPLCGSSAEWVLAKGPKEGTAKLTLYLQGRQAWLEAREKAEKMKDEVDPVAVDFFNRRIREVAGLDVTFRMQVPGDVVLWTKNLDKTGPREVVAHVTAADIRTPENLVRWLAPRFEVIFDAAGCKLPLE